MIFVMLERKLQKKLLNKLDSGKAIILLGARQVGKTTLLKRTFGDDDSVLWLNGDELDVQALFGHVSASRLKALFGKKKTIIIDEAQRIPDVGLRLKLITDEIPDVQLVATGSSAFELANNINEPLTGRKWEYQLYPLSFGEMVDHHGLLEEKRLLRHRLLYGYYPDIVTHPGHEKERLRHLTDSYLYKDILVWEQIKKPDHLLKLMQAIAFQIGSQVSYAELGQLSGLDSKTVEKYIMLLEQVFVIFRLGSFSRNLRNELKHSRKIYFYDNGIRNALITNFAQVEERQDAGALWENFLVSERIKHLQYTGRWVNQWYWRTKTRKEIDLVEEEDGKVSAYEFKWNPKAKIKAPDLFLRNYPDARFKVIHQDNFDEFLL